MLFGLILPYQCEKSDVLDKMCVKLTHETLL